MKALNRMLYAKDGFEGGMNTRKYMSLTKTSRATAYRELAQMVEWGCLQANEKGGRSSGYLILMDHLCCFSLKTDPFRG